MRVTIKPHNRSFIEKISVQAEIKDYSEVINYLILELKRLGYSFNAQMPVYQPLPQSHQPELEYTPPTDSLLTPSEQLDPIISRLAELVDTF